MDSNALGTSPLHRCSFQWTGIDTIAMDINPFVAGGGDAAVAVGVIRGTIDAPIRLSAMEPAVVRQTTAKTSTCVRAFAKR